MKKTISLVLIIFILICSIPSMSAFSESGSTGDCTWELDGTVLVIKGNGAMSNYDRVSAPWGKEITEVVVEKGVTTIGQFAFADCRNMTSIILPEGLEVIRENAFDGCANLSGICIPESVKEIKYSAFFGCSSLQTLVLPDNISTLSEYAFYQCSSIKALVLGKGITGVGYKCFYGCSSLTDIYIPQSTKSISISAFDGCTSLENVWYGGSATDKNSIRISSKNTALTGATWNFSADLQLKKTADCSQNGLLEIVCEGGAARVISLPKTPHGFSKWEVEKAAECEKSGILARECSLCGYRETKEIDALGHSFGDFETVIAPTCENKGVKQQTCITCGTISEAYVEPLGHSFSIITENITPTCTAEGKTTVKCSICRKETVESSSAGHVYKNGSCVFCESGYRVVESAHDYADNSNIKTKLSFPNAQKLTIAFSEDTFTEAEYDFINILDKAGNIKSQSSGKMLSGRTITVEGDTVTIQLISDGSNTGYGYFATVTPHSVLGDTDGNGYLNAYDLINVRNAILSDNKNLAYDINDDGLVNLIDLIRIKKMLAA